MEILKADLFQNLIRDLKSLRALWTWVYLSLYVWVCIWALRHRPQAAQTVVTVTGGLASSIFAGYVFSKSFEKKHRIGNYAPPPASPEPNKGDAQL